MTFARRSICHYAGRRDRLRGLIFVLRLQAFAKYSHYAALSGEHSAQQVTRSIAASAWRVAGKMGSGSVAKVMLDDEVVTYFVVDSTPLYARAITAPLATIISCSVDQGWQSRRWGTGV